MEIDHPVLKDCPRCGSKPDLCSPPYADDWDTCVICPECELSTECYILGIYAEGETSAIEEWNSLQG